jgi:uracil phosphoribosyltransferase
MKHLDETEQAKALAKHIDHPLIRQNMTKLRDKNTPRIEFRRLLAEIALLMGYEIARSFETEEIKVETPLEATTGYKLKREVVLVPILRAGLGMLDGIISVIPDAKVGFIGLKRNETTLASEFYYQNLPKNLKDHEVILIDPMLATGGSIVTAMELLQGAERVQLLSLVASPQGILNVAKHYPKLNIYTAAIDRGLNEKGYILPGLGDAGDRLFGT